MVGSLEAAFPLPIHNFKAAGFMFPFLAFFRAVTHFNPFPNKPLFLHVFSISLMKTL